jgi:hypothetical protein
MNVAKPGRGLPTTKKSPTKVGLHLDNPWRRKSKARLTRLSSSPSQPSNNRHRGDHGLPSIACMERARRRETGAEEMVSEARARLGIQRRRERSSAEGFPWAYLLEQVFEE